MLLHFSRLFLALCAGQALAQATQWPLHDDGLNQVVEWDHYSLKIRGERLLVWSGEFHYWRIPVPNVWKDLLQKVKAGGFNTVSVYSSWAYHNPSPGELIFEGGGHDIEPIFQYAKDIGLWIIFRPGPYINAETNAGGFPGWVTTGDYGQLRDNDTRYTEAWTPYFSKISQIVSKHTIVKGGNVIMYQLENEMDSEFTDPIKKIPYYPSIEYMENLQTVARNNGIDVPLFTNAGGRSWSKDYSNFGGEQDLYGIDSYPQCWSCDKSECEQYGVFSRFLVVNYEKQFSLVSPTQPSFLPEFQGGSYNPWGGPLGGCRNESDADFVNVFYRDNISQRVTINSLYMIYGGTNWGGLSCPVVASSYDYSAPIQEDRRIAAKFAETKFVGLQLRVARDLTKTEHIGNSTSYATNPVIHVTELRNNDTNSAFYFVRHEPSNLTTTDNYKLNIDTSVGKQVIPQAFDSMELIGHESKVLSTDYSLTAGRTAIYSTAEILMFSTITNESPLLVLWVPSGGRGEILLKGVGEGKAVVGSATITGNANGTKLLSFQQEADSKTIVQFRDGLRILIVDRVTATKLWAPSLSTTPITPDNQTIIVTGPSLVREVLAKGSSISLLGDVDSKAEIEVFASEGAREIIWNGRTISSRRTSYGSLIASLEPSSLDRVQVGPFENWKAADALPEREASYDDSKWTKADLLNTSSFTTPETYPVLYAEEYGIYMGNVLWRGRFPATTNATGVFLKVNGGTSFGYSVYLNGGLIGSWRGYRYTGTANTTLDFSNATLASSGENVLLVVQDHSGKDLRGDALIPRGIYNATLLGEGVQNFTSWRVAGTAGHKRGGGELIDPVRGPLAEGGLHAERLGWHLPGFDDKSWPASNGPSDGLSKDGMVFYRSTISTFIPEGVDASFAFEVTDPGTTKDFRVQLYVNGYQYGKFWSRIGHQIEFPVPPGVLDYSGKPNTIGVALWAQDERGAKVGLSLKLLKAIESSFDPMNGTDELRPGYSDRSKYY